MTRIKPSYTERITYIVCTVISEQDGELLSETTYSCHNNDETNRIIKELLAQGWFIESVRGGVIDNTYVEYIYME